MAFATRADLLARSNARRLAQLAVPSDVDMVPDEALRAAVAGGDLTGFTPEEQSALALALDAIDKALADADALVLSYGIPATVQTTLLARIASTIALFYLQGTERMTDDVQKAYDAQIALLTGHAKGTLSLLPPVPPVEGEPPPNTDVAIIDSGCSRYGAQRYGDDDE